MQLVSTPTKNFFALLKHAAVAWSDDRAATMGAAIAYYTALSLAPLIVIVVSVAGLVFGEDAARGALFDQLAGLLGDEGAKAVQTMVASARGVSGGIISISISVGVLVVGATTVFAELQNDLDLIWRSEPREGSGIVKFLLSRVLSFGLVLAVGFLLTVSLVASAAITAIGSLWGQWLGGAAILVEALNLVAGLAIITVLFALIFRYLPRARTAWRDVWLGALLTSALFSVGRFGIGLYIGHSAFSSAFGAAGAFVVIIVWFYYAAQIFLFGAEFTAQYALRFGSRASEAPRALRQPLAPGTAPAVGGTSIEVHQA